MILRLLTYAVGACLVAGFVWFAAQVVLRGLRAFFTRNDSETDGKTAKTNNKKGK